MCRYILIKLDNGIQIEKKLYFGGGSQKRAIAQIKKNFNYHMI